MTARRAAAAAVPALLAALAAAAAFDLRGWDSALAAGRAHDALLPGDPVGRALDARAELRYRDAVRSFEVALRARRGFDNGERRVRARAEAEALLAGVAAGETASRAAHAENLLGVLVVTGGRIVGGETAAERARGAFETAIRIDPARDDAKFNLELLLRRERPVGTREGPDSGSGPRGRSQRGAGAGTPGRGY